MLLFLNTVTNWLLFLSLAIVTGVVIGRWTILGDPWEGGDPLLREARVTAARWGGLATLALSVALVLVFWRQLIEFRDPFAPLSEDVHLLLRGTPWGTAWILAMADTLVIGVSFALVARGRAGAWWPVTVTGLAVGAFPALTGHANTGDLRAVTLVADTFHVWAAGGWIGGLGLVLLLDHRHGRADRVGATGILPTLVSRFSPVAMAGVATLIVTGGFASWVQLGGIEAVFGTPYGRLLVLKLAVVGGVLA
ncbi:MAG: CopD family protein, partial [Gemmatimonadota bacterium]|nr:CopD family protein [Gemmatimonadota bacterium]